MNIGKWVLRNLFIGFIREEQRSRRPNSNVSDGDGMLAPSIGRISASRTSTESMRYGASSSSRRASSSPESARKSSHRVSGSHIVVHSSKMIPAVPPNVSPSDIRSSPLLAPLIPLNTKDGQPGLAGLPQSPGVGIGTEGGGGNGGGSDMLAALPSFQRQKSTDGGGTPSGTQGDYFTPRIRQASLQGQASAEEASAAVSATTTANTGAASASAATTGKQDPQGASLTTSGLMGRLRNFGRLPSKRPTSDGVASSPVLGSVTPAVAESAAVEVSAVSFAYGTTC